jgi:ribosome maturation factor RimP
LITKEHIENLASRHLEGSNLYVTGVRVGSDNHISVFIDGDNGVKIQDCIDLSRAIEGKLDRNREDFALDVSSHGAASPIVLPRQYKKHLGREFTVKLNDGEKCEGVLVDIYADGIRLEYSTRENKPVGKGKITVTNQKEIKYNQIKESKIKLKY